ncbi:unnamed protein product [Cuscuta epithymum]|uniref:Uncharacterized protein n=1 Tax=Cuscuta epithymum TaxID=186058 RepID=A0AAV0FI44_9ASTE|nr:unnamed protein product [Cuscuta epithymum]
MNCFSYSRLDSSSVSRNSASSSSRALGGLCLMRSLSSASFLSFFSCNASYKLRIYLFGQYHLQPEPRGFALFPPTDFLIQNSSSSQQHQRLSPPCYHLPSRKSSYSS